MPETLTLDNFEYYMEKARDIKASPGWRDYFCNCANNVLTKLEELNPTDDFSAQQKEVTTIKTEIIEAHNKKFIESQLAA